MRLTDCRGRRHRRVPCRHCSFCCSHSKFAAALKRTSAYTHLGHGLRGGSTVRQQDDAAVWLPHPVQHCRRSRSRRLQRLSTPWTVVKRERERECVCVCVFDSVSVAVVVSGFGIHGEVQQCLKDSLCGRGDSPMLRLASSATHATTSVSGAMNLGCARPSCVVTACHITIQ